MFLTECPRDAMQGWGEFIPTQKKIDYINALMEVGFDVLDCGSFVSPKAIPQMADTKDVIPEIHKKNNTKKQVSAMAFCLLLLMRPATSRYTYTMLLPLLPLLEQRQ